MSDEGCKNGCVIPLSFPLRPGQSPPAVHENGCSCCGAGDRVNANNRPALPHFNYRIGTYGTIREYLFDRMNQTTGLQNWTHRGADDPAIALLEGASILGDILTFYQETYANEAFLRTAQWRESVADLVRLLGYRLSPAVGGTATFAFEIKKDEPVTVPAGFPLKATLEELEKPAEFETKTEITAYPWLSRFNLFSPLNSSSITPATTEFYVSGSSLVELKVGERLIVGDAATDNSTFNNAEIVIVDSVREQHGVKIYKVKGKLVSAGTLSNLFAYRVGRTFHHFGYNSGATVTSSTSATTTTTPGTGGAVTITSNIPTTPVRFYRPPVSGSAPVSPVPTNTQFPIDSEVRDLTNGAALVIQTRYATDPTLPPPATELYKTKVRTITDIKPVTFTWGTITGAVSLLTVSSSLDVSGKSMYIVDALIHEATSPLFQIQATKPENTTGGSTLNFFGTAGQAKDLEGRDIMLEKTGAEPKILSVKEVAATPDSEFPQLYRITLSENVTYSDFPNEGDPVFTVYGNLVKADEGKTIPEAVLGSGDATSVFQNFKLPKAPLTYHLVVENTPPETPETDIYVDGRLWTQVGSFFGRKADEQIYIVREDTDGNSWVQFGDGKTGARLNTGTNNVTAIYRTGTGAYGPLKIDTKVQASAKLRNLDKVQMPKEATGGSTPEDGDNARSAAPGKVQSLGRIVSLRDFEAEAIAIAGVVSASATWELEENVAAVFITVLMETGRGGEISSIGATLNSYNTLRGAGRSPIVVVSGKRKYVAVSVQYDLKPGFRDDLVKPEIMRALGVNYAKPASEEDQTGLFSLNRQRFGGNGYASSIEGAVQNVEGVLWAKTTAFAALFPNDKDPRYNDPRYDDPNNIPLPSAIDLKTSISCDSVHILSLYDKHLSLKKTEGS